MHCTFSWFTGSCWVHQRGWGSCLSGDIISDLQHLERFSVLLSWYSQTTAYTCNSGVIHIMVAWTPIISSYIFCFFCKFLASHITLIAFQMGINSALFLSLSRDYLPWSSISFSFLSTLCMHKQCCNSPRRGTWGITPALKRCLEVPLPGASAALWQQQPRSSVYLFIQLALLCCGPAFLFSVETAVWLVLCDPHHGLGSACSAELWKAAGCSCPSPA